MCGPQDIDLDNKSVIRHFSAFKMLFIFIHNFYFAIAFFLYQTHMPNSTSILHERRARVAIGRYIVNIKLLLLISSYFFTF